MRDFYLAIVVLIILYCLGSGFLFWYWTLKGKRDILVLGSIKERYYFIFLGSLFALGMLFYLGFEKVFFFVPSSWGNVAEDGEFESTRSILAGFFATAASLYVHLLPHRLVTGLPEARMFSFFQRNPPEIDQLLEKIEEAERRMPPYIASIAKPLLALLAHNVRSKWSTHDKKDYASQIQGGEKHEAFIYNFIVQTVGDKLESGQYHVYRGVLNTEGKGYKQLFNHAIDAMISTGCCTKEWADMNFRAPVSKGIDAAG